MSDYNLDYLFLAETISGDIIRQAPDDRPRFSKVGSSFSEVQDKHLKSFSLIGKGHVFTVNLIDGHFEIDGRVAYPPKMVPQGATLKLIYYRQVQRSLQIGVVQLGKMLPPKVKYVLGWKYTKPNGKTDDYKLGIE